MNRIYADRNENTDYELMLDFNEVLKLKNLGKTPERHYADASGYTQDGRTALIELKKRNFQLGKYKTFVAEGHKLADLIMDAICDDKVPLFINFLDDGHVVVFNLMKLKHRPQRQAQRNYSKLYEGYELSIRQFLDIEDAWIWQKQDDYKLIKRGS